MARTVNASKADVRIIVTRASLGIIVPPSLIRLNTEVIHFGVRTSPAAAFLELVESAADLSARRSRWANQFDPPHRTALPDRSARFYVVTWSECAASTPATSSARHTRRIRLRLLERV